MNSDSSTNKPQSDKDSPVKLCICDLNKCEARCCYDGVYLEPGEEKKIREVVASAPGFFVNLPADFIVDGSWGDTVSGPKTATKAHDYKAPDFPLHFNRTRCVFCDDDHKCLLQKLAVARSLHKWAYKPTACWMFPMRIIAGEPAPPPGPTEEDPHSIGEEYPGYSKFVPCGQHHEEGDAWESTLAEEISYWRAAEPSREVGESASLPSPSEV